jgi:hypothetical protein
MQNKKKEPKTPKIQNYEGIVNKSQTLTLKPVVLMRKNAVEQTKRL